MLSTYIAADLDDLFCILSYLCSFFFVRVSRLICTKWIDSAWPIHIVVFHRRWGSYKGKKIFYMTVNAMFNNISFVQPNQLFLLRSNIPQNFELYMICSHFYLYLILVGNHLSVTNIEILKFKWNLYGDIYTMLLIYNVPSCILVSFTLVKMHLG